MPLKAIMNYFGLKNQYIFVKNSLDENSSKKMFSAKQKFFLTRNTLKFIMIDMNINWIISTL